MGEILSFFCYQSLEFAAAAGFSVVALGAAALLLALSDIVRHWGVSIRYFLLPQKYPFMSFR
ncbi:hypothetical protein [Pleionea sediminis]|uniref:hypothetical protein n=1 Tax=Pleionea sediminis TaxID=2569479 RepID=UPI001184FDC2|nr:hypothetical protein [Pleionea sediminis]